MNAPLPLCKYCHGTSNALTTLVPDGRGQLRIQDPKKDGRFVTCGACTGTGVMPGVNSAVIDLLKELADCPTEFLDELDEDGIPLENPDYDDDEELDHREKLIRAARALLTRLKIRLPE